MKKIVIATLLSTMLVSCPVMASDISLEELQSEYNDLKKQMLELESKIAAYCDTNGIEFETSSSITEQVPDRYTQYVRDYTGMNLASFGYNAMGGFRADTYGKGWVKFVVSVDDASYLDATDEEELKHYKVIEQNPIADTEIDFTYQLKDDGTEYDNLISFQSVDQITLTVERID